MPDFSQIPYIDLTHELRNSRLPLCIGREQEIARLRRVFSRSLRCHAVLVGPSGSGLSATVFGLAKNLYDGGQKRPLLLIDARNVLLTAASASWHEDAFESISNAAIYIEHFGGLVYNNLQLMQAWANILKPLLSNPDTSLILDATPAQYDWLRQNAPQFLENFEHLAIGPQADEEYKKIIAAAAAKLSGAQLRNIPEEILDLCISLVRRFPALGQLPKAAIQLLDEAAAETRLKTGGKAFNAHPALRHAQKLLARENPVTVSALLKIVAEKTGVPIQAVSGDEKTQLKELPQFLNSRIVGQKTSTDKISSVVQRAKLGLRSSSRPLASFLVLGPSGVGKTETAKLLAQKLYGRPESFLRIDMSEFSEAHTAQRLVGAPPGYSGFDSGGQLTNHLKQFPYSLILLDEIEKAHNQVFDIFLQLLDDGRLTSGQGETVDATNAIIMATSNLGVEEIIRGFNSGAEISRESFIKEVLVPELAKRFRLEFINRFDSVLVYNPLSVDDLLDIARLEIYKIEQRLKQHGAKFTFTDAVLRAKISELADTRFGARPVKRFIETMCETIITQKLLQ